MRIPTEQDLGSNNHEVWAKATMKCQAHNPYCGADGRCQLGGECFIEPEMSLDQALQEIKHLQKELDASRVERNQVLALHTHLEARLKVAKDAAQQQGKSERVFAIMQCLSILKREYSGEF